MSAGDELVVTTPGDRVITMSRLFAAPVHLVFAALTTPELLMRWYGARGWHLVECVTDVRAGGAYRLVSRGPGGERMGQSGVYREVDPPRRLAYTEVFDDQSYRGESIITQEFREESGRTKLTSTIIYPSAEAREIALRYPMRRGVTESYHRLDVLLRASERRTAMKWTLEVVIVPVSDLDRAKAFYADQLGFDVDHDTTIGDDARIIQLTPPGSGCSIVIGKGAVPEMPPGSLKGLQLVVPDIRRAHAELVERGVDVSDVQVLGENPGPVPDPLDNVGFVFFSDPDGNAWGVQQISARGGTGT